MAGMFVGQTSGSVCVAVTGAAPGVMRAAEMEAALGGDFSSAAIKDIQVSTTGLNSDVHTSAEYRAHLVNAMARYAVDAADGRLL